MVCKVIWLYIYSHVRLLKSVPSGYAGNIQRPTPYFIAAANLTLKTVLKHVRLGFSEKWRFNDDIEYIGAYWKGKKVNMAPCQQCVTHP